ncbi:MAG: ASKHA domain-containing protein [Promethearchaeota archaeon]
MGDSERYGISVDIGTTNITFHLYNLSADLLVKETTVTNPQREYGEEIISRIDFARKPENASKLTEIVRDCVKNGVENILEESKCNRKGVDSVVVVGNTVMHHLFFGLSTNSLLKPPYRAQDKSSILIKSTEVGLNLHEGTLCYSPPVIESFIGADAVAMMLASGFLDSDCNLVSIDVGTNTEIAVLHEGEVWIASAASGPAFEGMSIECGTPGYVGAISRVVINPDDYRPQCEIIGGGKPIGICGTGVISTIASMLDTGILFARGSFNRSRVTPWLVTDAAIIHYVLATSRESATNSEIILTQPDIRMLQQSKASIRAALGMVLQEAQMDPSDVETIYLTGVFGSGLILDDAIRIGLLPVMINAEVKQEPAGASRGADLLHDLEIRKKAERLVSEVNYIELTDNPHFKKKFTENIPFP